MNTGKMQKEKNIQVFVRVRGINASEKLQKSVSVVECSNKEVVIKERPLEKITKTFTFDKVFGPNSKQIDVYKSVVHPLIEEVLAGYNCTVFAYGQTGTGKTYTMEGERSDVNTISWEDDPLSGIIPRSLSHLFDELRIQQVEHTVRVSFLELYNEELFDLLSAPDDTSKIRLFEDASKKGSVIIHGLEEVTVHNKNEVYKIMEKGSHKRQTAATFMNAQSSRSHTVFSITVHIKENSVDGEELLKTGKLNLVDLAGSENISRSGAVDKRAREAGNINQSLLTLGRVITSLVEHAPHIPYRESKLTRLLQDSLGGRTKTSIIATISPASINMEETLSTLDYAHRAKNITNRPEINQKLTKKTLLKEYTEEIERLRRDLEASREKNGVYVHQDNYNEMVATLEQQDRDISIKMEALKAQKEELAKKEEVMDELNMVLETKERELTKTRRVLGKREQKLRETREQLQKTSVERDENGVLLLKHVETEDHLAQQAKVLVDVVQQSSEQAYKLHDKIDRQRIIEKTNHASSTKFQMEFTKDLAVMEVVIEGLREKQQEVTKHLQSALSLSYDTQENGYSVLKLQNEKAINSMLAFMAKMNQEDQINNSKGITWAEEYLKNVQSRAASEQANITDAIASVILPAMQAFSVDIAMLKTTLNDHLKSLSAVSMSLNTELELNKVRLASVEEKRAELDGELNWLKQSFAELLSKNASLREQEETHNKELMKKMEEMTLCISAKHLNSIEALSAHGVELSKASDRAVQLGDQGYRSLIEQSNYMIQSYDSRIGDCRQQLDVASNTLIDATDAGVTEAMARREDSVSAVRLAVNGRAQVWAEHCSWTEASIVQMCDQLNACLQHQATHNQSLTEELERHLSKFAAASESQRAEYESFVRNTFLTLKDESSEMKNLCLAIKSCLIERSQEINYFLDEGLKKDVPTGLTPQRQEFRYPKMLVATSPHERILQRFRATRGPPPQFSDSEDATCDSSPGEASEECNSLSDLEIEQFTTIKITPIRKSLSADNICEPPSSNSSNKSNKSQSSLGKGKENRGDNIFIMPLSAKRVIAKSTVKPRVLSSRN